MKLVRLLLYLLLLTIPLGQLGRIPVGGEHVNLYLPDVLIPLLIFVWLGYALAVRKKLELPPLSNYIFLFGFVALISLINGKRFIGMGELIVSAMYLIRWIMYVGIYFVVWDVVREEKPARHDFVKAKSGGGGRRKEQRITNFLIFSGVVLAVAGFVQLAVLPDFTKLDPEMGWDPHKNRLASTFLDPNFTGAYLVLTLTLILSRILYGPPSSASGGLRVVFGGAVVFVALILTFSRSAWLMFAVVMGVMGVLKSRKLLILALIAFLSAYALVPRVQTRIAGGVDPDDSARARIASWKDTLEIVQDHPVIGVGFNAFRYAQARYGFFDFREPLGGRAGAGSDSSLMLVLAATGAVGLFAFLLLGFKALWPLAPFSGGKKCGVNLTVLAGFAGLLAESNFINSLFYPWIMIWMWTMAALAGRQVQNSKRKTPARLASRLEAGGQNLAQS